MRAARRQAPRRRAVEELLRARAHLVDVHPARVSPRSTGSTRSSRRSRRCATPTWPRSGPGTPSARPPSSSTTPTRSQPAAQAPGHLHEHHRQHRAGLGPGRRRPAGEAPAVPRLVPDHPGVGHPPRAVEAQELRGPHPPGRGRDRRHRRRASVRPSAATSASPPPAVPGVALKSETIGLAVSLELPLLIIDIQRGGPSTGLPTKTEQADLLHGHVRPPRRVAAADRGRLQPGALLRRRHRGGPHRPQVPHPGDPALRRLPGQRRRAVAAPRRRRPARHLASRSPPSPTTPTTTATPTFWPYLRDPDTLARPWAVPGHAGPRAPHRRHREGGRHRQHLLRPREPRAHGPAARRQGRRHRRRHPRRRGARRRRRRRDPRRRLGLDLGRDRRRGRPRAGPGPPGRPRPPHPPQPVPGQPRRGAAPLPARCSCPR